MKLVFALLVLAMSATSFARHTKTLEQYDASYNFDVKWPSINFSLASVAVKNVCIDGDTLKTINPVKLCTKTAPVEVCTITKESENCRKLRKGETPKDGPRTRIVYGCVAYEGKALETSRSYEEKVCATWKRNPARHGKDSSEPMYICTSYKTVTKEYADNYDVEVYAVARGDHEDRLVDTINFELPACK